MLNDNTVRLGGLTLDIPPGPRGRSYAKARVDVRQHLDGAWTVFYQDQAIARPPASTLAEPLRHLKDGGPRSQRTKAARQELFVYLPNSQPPGMLPSTVKRTYCLGLNNHPKILIYNRLTVSTR